MRTVLHLAVLSALLACVGLPAADAAWHGEHAQLSAQHASDGFSATPLLDGDDPVTTPTGAVSASAALSCDHIVLAVPAAPIGLTALMLRRDLACVILLR